jgi:hypothetical protein
MKKSRPITRGVLSVAIFVAMAAVGGCSHIAGVVVDERQRPVTTAVLSVGRPDAIAVYETHKVNAQGRFDFQLSGIDETNLYAYDGAGDPRMTLRHIDPSELGTHMRIMLPRAAPADDVMKVPPGVMEP